jgi:hypothetical protein
MFNLLAGPELFERVEAALPEHRERLFPPTGTLSMFVAQVLSADGSCQHVVNASASRGSVCVYCCRAERLLSPRRVSRLATIVSDRSYGATGGSG